MTDDPDAGQVWLAPRAKKLVPYAGTELARKRNANKRDILAEIFRRQQDGQLLSEIGAAIQTREIVRALVIAWLWRLFEDSPADRP